MRPGFRQAAVCLFCRFARPITAYPGRTRYLPEPAFVQPVLRPGSTRHSSSRNSPQREKLSRNESRKARRPSPGFPKRLHDDFQQTLKRDLRFVKKAIQRTQFATYLENESFGFKNVWRRLEDGIFSDDPRLLDRDLITTLQDRFVEFEGAPLQDQLTYAFYELATNDFLSSKDIENQVALADLRYPNEWYPITRQLQRTIHVHVGPTNSGKTYHALKRLESAKRGLFAGPLRLLAHEVYTRMNDAGKPCVLITGDEIREPPDKLAEASRHQSIGLASCTVEMLPAHRRVDVAVIDEIQMLASPERGWAWTQALLGTQADEVHVCGETRVVPLIRSLCASIGDNVVLHEYKRLSPLAMDKKSLNGDLSSLRPGDCIVCFSVVGIHHMRRRIEQETKRNVAIVYGSLPPETRAHQARLFNDPDNDYDYLVASDAIGMGLNLAIKRVVFETTFKYDGTRLAPLAIPDVKQIAGRAGRYKLPTQGGRDSTIKSAPSSDDSGVLIGDAMAQDKLSKSKIETDGQGDSNGLVTTVEKFDFAIVKRAMETEPQPIQSAGIKPPRELIERFARYYPPCTPLSFILQRLAKIARTSPQFHLCNFKDQSWIADTIESVNGLTIADKNIFTGSPASKSDKALYEPLLRKLAQCVAEQRGGKMTEILEIPLEYLSEDLEASRPFLRKLELLHKAVTTYLWLGYRFAGIFPDRDMAFYVKGLVQEKISAVLESLNFTAQEAEKIRQKRERRALRLLQQEEEAKERHETDLVDEVEPPLDDHEDMVEDPEQGVEDDEHGHKDPDDPDDEDPAPSR